MNKLRSLYQFFFSKYQLLNVKKYTTIAGTLVFFLIMSIVPFSFWLTLIIGKLPVNTEEILALAVFDSVKEVLSYVQREAQEATAGASLVLLFTTLYSATNLFYQMRRSGEIIYDYRQEKKGFRLRLGALVLLIIVMAGAVAFLLIFALGSFLFSRVLSEPWEKIADYALLITVAFGLALLLNMYICPHKVSVRYFLSGTAITVGLWLLAGFGFSIYLKISNMGRLYGALSTIIVFLLWLYVLMICFVIGVIWNSEKITVDTKKEKKTKKKSA